MIIEEDYDLKNKHLFKKNTGKAKYYCQLQFNENLDEDLKQIAMFTKGNNIKFKIYGMHTNLYITDNGFNGLFVDISPQNSNIRFNENDKTFFVSGNLLVSQLVNFAMEMGYDFAALTGVPGMIGSGIVGNAGWTPSGKAFSDFVKQIIVYDFKEEKEKVLVPDELFFSERNSWIKKENKINTRYFVKSAIIKTEYIGREKVKEKYDAQMDRRRLSLQIGFKEGSAGSIFSNAHLKRESGKSLPQMIRENPSIRANFNGARFGDEGSHFFTTDEKTTDRDVAMLMEHTLKKLKELYNVIPKLEMLILDYDGEIDLKTFIERNLI